MPDAFMRMTEHMTIVELYDSYSSRAIGADTKDYIAVFQ